MSQTAIITGGARGLGEAMARRMASLGYNVVIGDLPSSQEKAQSVLDDIKQQYQVDGCLSLGDLSTYDGCEKLAHEAYARFHSVEVLINNIGISNNLPFVELTQEKYERLIQIDLLSYFHMCKQVVPHMIEAKNGCIINVASVGGMMGVPEMADYCASKAGVIGLTRSLAVELGKYQIRVNAIAPGNTMTDMLRGYDQEALESFVASTPLGRVGDPEDIVDAAEFLVKASYVTGQTISPNGGLLNP